jgi:hypothetical protein
MVNAPKSCENCEKNAQIMQKKVQKCEKWEEVRNANAMQKWNQNSHRIASHYCDKFFFAFFCIAFASHYHPCQIVQSQLFTSLWNGCHQWLSVIKLIQVSASFMFLIHDYLLCHCWKARANDHLHNYMP